MSFLKWKEDEESNEGYKIDKYLRKMCGKERFIELMFHFILFDGAIICSCRPIYCYRT